MIRHALLIGLALTTNGPDDDLDTGPALLASFEQVRRDLDDPGLRLLDVRSRADYEAGHLPGAVWVDAEAAKALAARPEGLTDADAWRDWIAPLGIEPGMTVLAYDAARQKDAARCWWLLGYLGVDRVGLLDGGFPLWVSEGRPVSTEEPDVAPHPFPVAFQADRLATRSEVLDAIESGTAQVVDARSLEEHTGEVARSAKGGHVPTACHLEWSTLVDENGRFLPEPALRSRLDDLGLKAGTPTITHCQSGGRASVDTFVLRRLGIPTRNYYLGWSDWGNAEETPVRTGPESDGNIDDPQ